MLYKKGFFEIFDTIDAFQRELGIKLLIKRGFYRNFNDSFIGF